MNIFPDDGNVSIGTTSPAAKLHVQGALILQGGDGRPPAMGFASEAGEELAAVTAAEDHSLTISCNGGIHVTDPSMTVDTFHVTGAGKVHARGPLTVEGNVGIGTTEPGAKLEVAGDAKVTGPLIVGGKVQVYGNIQVTGATYSQKGRDEVGGGETIYVGTRLPAGIYLVSAMHELVETVEGYVTSIFYNSPEEHEACMVPLNFCEGLEISSDGDRIRLRSRASHSFWVRWSILKLH